LTPGYRKHDEARLNEGGVVDEDIYVTGTQVDEGQSTLEKFILP
jgi:hypothetical protein